MNNATWKMWQRRLANMHIVKTATQFATKIVMWPINTILCIIGKHPWLLIPIAIFFAGYGIYTLVRLQVNSEFHVLQLYKGNHPQWSTIGFSTLASKDFVVYNRNLLTYPTCLDNKIQRFFESRPHTDSAISNGRVIGWTNECINEVNTSYTSEGRRHQELQLRELIGAKK